MRAMLALLPYPLPDLTWKQIAEMKKAWRALKKHDNGPVCKICGQPFSLSNGATIDHIIPRHLDGIIDSEIVHSRDNQRIMCERCNLLRAASGDCLGMMACMVAVIGDKSLSSTHKAIMRMMPIWLFPEIGREMRRTAPGLGAMAAALGAAGLHPSEEANP